MSTILYYSKYCENCKKILYELGKTNLQKEMHFVCIDKRRQEKEKTYVLLDNGKELLMPNTLTKVPGLLLLNRGNQILYGDGIMNFLRPQMNNERGINRNNPRQTIEPSAFSFSEGTAMSDHFSYLDQNSNSLAAKGDGGLRQMHNFSGLNDTHTIETPPEDYVSEKLGNINFDDLQKQRSLDAQIPNQ